MQLSIRLVADLSPARGRFAVYIVGGTDIPLRVFEKLEDAKAFAREVLALPIVLGEPKLLITDNVTNLKEVSS